jgi:hypothetical protein
VNQDDTLVDRYEEIRRTLLARHQGVMMWGLVVLRTKGMAAWARSWQEYGEGGVTHMPSEPAATSSHLPPNGEEVVRVLAGMVWAIQEEAVL